MEWQKDWGPDFYGGSFKYDSSKLDEAGRVHCFDECGGAFFGYLASGGTNPVVVFSDPEAFPPTTINEFVAVSSFIALTMIGPIEWPNCIEDGADASTLASSNTDTLLWQGFHLSNLVEIWLVGERLICRGWSSTNDLVIRRPRLHTETPISSVSFSLPVIGPSSWVTLTKDQPLEVPIYEETHSRGDSATALEWADLRNTGTKGLLHKGTYSIPWSAFSGLWDTLVESLVLTRRDDGSWPMVSVMHEESDISLTRYCSNPQVLHAIASQLSR
jgi:hypothetical protein